MEDVLKPQLLFVSFLSVLVAEWVIDKFMWYVGFSALDRGLKVVVLCCIAAAIWHVAEVRNREELAKRARRN